MAVRVLVVDDSVVVRRVVGDALRESGIDVVATAPNGRVALAKIGQLLPDLVIADLEMPVMDGLELLGHLRTLAPELPVVVFSTRTAPGAAATRSALERGARDCVTKPGNLVGLSAATQVVRDLLVPRVLALCPDDRPDTGDLADGRTRRSTGRTPTRVVDVVVIGSSTGGPHALAEVLPALPAALPVPVLVTQHMPPVFTKRLADRLDQRSEVRVSEAADGDRLQPGLVLVAPGDRHLTLLDGRVLLSLAEPENFCRPAVDVMFRSAAAAYGPGVLAVVLTGMGVDGARGAAEIVAAGGEVVAQDEATSVVWGMPGAVAGNGVASAVLALDQVAAAITARCAVGRGLGAADPILPTGMAAGLAARG